MNSRALILNNSSFSLWAGYMSNSKEIYYPKPLFPEPKHISLKNLLKSDLIMDHWKEYKIIYST